MPVNEEEKEMNEQMRSDYKKAMAFWDQALASSPEDYESGIDPAEGWKKGCSETLLALLCEGVKGWDNVLDYGCGTGWASVLLVKNGARRVTAVDVAPNAIASAGYYAKAFEVRENITFEAVTPEWLSAQDEDRYDHAISVNVLDVVPDEIAEGIIRGLSKVCKKGATLLIGLNPYLEGESLTKDGRVYTDHYLYIGDILRLSNHTDEEWTEMLSKCFKVERLEYFKWDQEARKARRLFYLTNKF